MAIYDRCNKCRTLKDIKTIGKNGVCADCMGSAIIQAEESNQAKTPHQIADTMMNEVVEEITEEAKEEEEVEEVEALPAFTLTKGDETKTFENRADVGAFLEKHPNAVSGAIRSGKPINGWDIVKA